MAALALDGVSSKLKVKANTEINAKNAGEVFECIVVFLILKSLGSLVKPFYIS